nr:integrase, catalytic region, zinc finger, CCHC-type, peptidase aspartic, catalytic [Tanacetum cinerariifolium]
MLSSRGETLPTSASGSQTSGNTKKDRILQTPSSAKKNKLEAYPRNVRTSFQNKKSVVNTKNISSLQESKFNVNSDLQCVTCNGCLFSDNHDSCVLKFINSVNARVKYLEVAFRQHTCFIHNLKGVDLLTGSRGNNLYTLSLGDMKASSPICLLSKASKTKSWLWHRRLCHLNFGVINHLARQGLVQGLLKLKFKKDHLCSACAMGKSKKKSYKPKSEDTNQEKLYLLHMDLCGPMQAVATVCYTKNRSIVRLLHNKTPYELLHGKLPDLSFLHVFGTLCSLTNDNENLGKLHPKADIGIFIGYAPTKKAFRIYNRRTRRIIKTIHVDFDELKAMASEQSSLGPALHEMTPTTISSELVPKPTSSTPFVPPSRNDFDQDSPSPSKCQTTPENQPPVIPQDVEEDNHEVAHMGNDLFFGMPILEVASDQSSSMDFTHAIVHHDHQISQHNS